MEFETYADVIDAYNADNMGYSTLTDYIKGQNIKIKEIEMDPIGDMQKIFENKADGGMIGIEVLFGPKRDEFSIGGNVQRATTPQPYDSRATAADFARAIDRVGAGTDLQKAMDIQRYGENVQRQNMLSKIKDAGTNLAMRAYGLDPTKAKMSGVSQDPSMLEFQEIKTAGLPQKDYSAASTYGLLEDITEGNPITRALAGTAGLVALPVNELARPAYDLIQGVYKGATDPNKSIPQAIKDEKIPEMLAGSRKGVLQFIGDQFGLTNNRQDIVDSITKTPTFEAEAGAIITDGPNKFRINADGSRSLIGKIEDAPIINRPTMADVAGPAATRAKGAGYAGNTKNVVSEDPLGLIQQINILRNGQTPTANYSYQPEEGGYVAWDGTSYTVVSPEQIKMDIEALQAQGLKDGGRVPMISGGFLKGIGKGIMELLESGANKKMFRSADDIPPITISKAEGPMTIEMMEAVDPSIVKKLLRTQELGLYEETPEILKAANLLERFTKKVKGKRVIDYERAEAILGVPLKGDETINDLFKIEFETRPVETMADGGRVGLFMGGPPLTGTALDIYNSMSAYGFSDAEIADALRARGLYDVAPVETPVINTAENIINQDRGGDGQNNEPPGFDLGYSSENFGLGPNQDVVDYEAEAAKIGPTFRGQFAKTRLGIQNLMTKMRSLPTPVNIALNLASKVGDFFSPVSKATRDAIEKDIARDKQGEITTFDMRATPPTKQDKARGQGGGGGYGAHGMAGRGAQDFADLKDGGLATMFKTRRR